MESNWDPCVAVVIDCVAIGEGSAKPEMERDLAATEV